MLLRNWTSQLFQQLAVLIFALFVATGAAHASATAAAAASSASAAASSLMQSRHVQQADQQAQELEPLPASQIQPEVRSQRPKTARSVMAENKAWSILGGFIAVVGLLLLALPDDVKGGWRIALWTARSWFALMLCLSIFGPANWLRYEVKATGVILIAAFIFGVAALFWPVKKTSKIETEGEDDRDQTDKQQDDMQELRDELKSCAFEMREKDELIEKYRAIINRLADDKKALNATNESLRKSVDDMQKLRDELESCAFEMREKDELIEEYRETINRLADDKKFLTDANETLRQIVDTKQIISELSEQNEKQNASMFSEHIRLLKQTLEVVQLENKHLTQVVQQLEEENKQSVSADSMESLRKSLLSFAQTLQEQNSRLEEFGADQLAGKALEDRSTIELIQWLKGKCSALQRQKDDLKHQLQLMREADSKALSQKKTLERRCKDLVRELTSLRRHINHMVSENAALLGERRDLEKALSDKGVQKLHWENKRLKTDLSNAQKEIQRLLKDKGQLMEKIEQREKDSRESRKIKTRNMRSEIVSPEFAALLTGLGGVEADESGRLWDTSVGRVKIDGRNFSCIDKPEKSGTGALNLVAAVMKVTRWQAVLIIKEYLGIGPALGAVREAVAQTKSALPDIAPQQAVERTGVS